MEVFSISGAGGCPTGWTATPKGNCGGSGAKYRNEKAVKLQNALNRAGAQVAVDGIVGPKTTAAVNAVLGLQLSKYDVADKAVALSVKILEKALATGAKAVPPAPVTSPEPTPAPAPAPAPPAVKRARQFPTAGVMALMGLNLVAAGVGGYLTWRG